MLEGALIAGLCSVGANVEILGIVPTPAVAYLVGKYNADAGIMISASHNPYEFNGIKIFSSQEQSSPMSSKIKSKKLYSTMLCPTRLPQMKISVRLHILTGLLMITLTTLSNQSTQI